MRESSHSRAARHVRRGSLVGVAHRFLSPLAPPACVSCGEDAAGSEPLCGRCRRALPWLGGGRTTIGDSLPLWAPVAHEGPARALVAALKFRGAVGLAETLAAQIVATAPPGWLESRGGARSPAREPPPVLVPVPLHRARRRRRGFNQAERIAVAIGARTGLGVAEPLRRTGPPERQVGRGGAERRGSIRGSVAIRNGALVPRTALLVDDVATTGATLAACATALRAGGAARLAAIAYARTPGR